MPSNEGIVLVTLCCPRFIGFIKHAGYPTRMELSLALAM